MVEIALFRLQRKLQAAGLSVVSVFGPPWRADLAAGATQTQINLAASMCAAFDGQSRAPKSLPDILTALQALSSGQKANIALDLFPTKWRTDAGPNVGDLLVLDFCVQTGTLSAADKNLAKLYAAALYVQDQPDYLVNPAFDPSILLYGDAPL